MYVACLKKGKIELAQYFKKIMKFSDKIIIEYDYRIKDITEYLENIDISIFEEEYKTLFIDNIFKFYSVKLLKLGDRIENLYITKYCYKILQDFDSKFYIDSDKINFLNVHLMYLASKSQDTEAAR